MSRGYKLKDRPEFNSKPKPITFEKHQKVSEAVKVMSDNNYDQNNPLNIKRIQNHLNKLCKKL